MTNKKWFNNNIIEIQINDSEKIPEGFVRGRIKRDTLKEISSVITKELLYKDYIIENKTFISLVGEYDITKKQLRGLITRYGIKKSVDLRCANTKKNFHYRTHEESVSVGKKSSKTQKQRWENKPDDEKLFWAKRCQDIQLNLPAEVVKKKTNDYLNFYNNLSSEEKATIQKRKSASLKRTWNNKKQDILAKRKETEKENRKIRLCRSVAEQKAYDSLKSVYDDVCYDIRVDNRYPFFCDFYIKSLDLFIELNAHPSHGRLPIRFLSVDEYSKYPNKWVDVFARRDVEKQKVALQNNINYIVIYPSATLDENLNINENKFSDIIELVFKSQS